MSHLTLKSIIGFVILSLVFKNIQSRGIHHRQRQGPEHISRVASFNLNTTNIFGLYLNSPYTITSDMRNALRDNLINAYTRTNCNTAMHNNCEILIARHRGNFGFNYDNHYDNLNSFAYGNSVTQTGSTMGNDVETQTISSRSERSADCPKGSPFDCTTDADDKAAIIQKCWLYDLFSGTHKPSGVTLHSMQYTQGKHITWSDISYHLKLLGDRLLPNRRSDVENFYSTIYSEIKCEIGDIRISTRKQIVNELYRKYADFIQKMHVRFHRLRYAEDSNKNTQNCFNDMLEFMTYLTTLATNVRPQGYRGSWEDIMIIYEDLRDNIERKYNQSYQQKHFCLQRMLVEYSAMIRDRAETRAAVLKVVEQDLCGRTCHNNDQYTMLKNSFNSNRDLFYGMTNKIFEYVVEVLYKAVLTTNPKGRVLSVKEENNKVETATNGLLHKATDIHSTFNPEQYWGIRLNRLNRKILREQQQTIQTV